MNGLTHLYLEIFLKNVVWTCQTFENNFGMKHKFAKYFKESCRQNSDELFLFKYFLNIAFVREISSKLSDGFSCYMHEWQKIYLTNVVWTFQTFENNFGLKQQFTNYLMESCRQNSDEQFSFKYFLNIAFVREISPKLSDCQLL